jgi:hypothetical protein
VTVLFIDIKDFTAGCAQMTVAQVDAPFFIGASPSTDLYRKDLEIKAVICACAPMTVAQAHRDAPTSPPYWHRPFDVLEGLFITVNNQVKVNSSCSKLTPIPVYMIL